ncbi:MAG: FixH family protein, partial [Collimonas sp.]|uniref:FixH family protein n=1 Tax=Collimonas sp. TaxID=1963772 RepID=UPI003264FE95
MNNRINLTARQPVVARPWYVQRWPWFVMLGPAIVVVAASYTCWLAFTRQDAMVEDDYYKEGNAINQDLRRDEEAIRRSINGSLRYDAMRGVLSGVLHNVDGPSDHALLPEADPTLHVRFIHSTLPEKDINLLIHPDVRGNFSVKLPLLDMARWQILIEDAHRDWRLHGVWAWPQQTGVELSPVAMKPA